MARFKHRPTESHSGDGEPRSEPGSEPEQSGLGRESLLSDPRWQDWFRDLGGKTDSDCVELLEIVYALGDLQARAQDMRLDFLVYLLGMALQEALEQLRAREPRDHPRPKAR